jgi:flotillin
MVDLVGIIIICAILGIMLLIIFIKANLVICQPNEIVIISGRRYKQEDGTEVGYRIIRGGRGFKIPIIESIKRIPLTAIPVEINLNKALCKGIIPVNIECRANIKIAGSPADGLNNAIERFLGKNLNEVAQIAKQTIEGSLRGVLATVTPEEANSERLKLAENVVEEARSDLKKLGILLDFFKIQTLYDDHGYLEAIGRKKNADILKDARIAEATAEAEASKISAEQLRIARIAEAQAQEEIIQAENKLAVHRAELALKTNQAEERAKIAREIARVEEEQQMQLKRIELNRKKFEADMIIPAQAEKEASELKSIGEASRILENGKATAEAIRLMQEQWQEGKTKDLFYLQMFPELLDKVTRVVADNLHIEKVTVLDSGNGNGIPTHIKNVTNSAISIIEQLKNATGLDLTDLLNRSVGNKQNDAAAIKKEFA